MASRRTIIEEWMMAQKRHHLSDVQVQMARELDSNRILYGRLTTTSRSRGKPRCHNTLRTSMRNASSVSSLRL